MIQRKYRQFTRFFSIFLFAISYSDNKISYRNGLNIICSALNKLIEECVLVLKPCYSTNETDAIKKRQTKLMNLAMQILIPDFDYQTSCDSALVVEYVPNDKLKIHGGWSEWLVWDRCSVSCGGSNQSRTRICNNPTPAYGGNECTMDGSASTEIRKCNEMECPGKEQYSLQLMYFLPFNKNLQCDK